MKITFLGTSHGRPLENRYCSSTMLETADGGIYLVDAGAPIADLFIRMEKDFTKLKGVFITHADADHIDGLMDVLKLCSNRYKSTAFTVVVTDERLPEVFKNCIQAMETAFADDRIKFVLANDGVVYDDGNVRASYSQNYHLKPFGKKSYSILIESENKKAVFTGDMSNHFVSDDFPKFALDQRTDFILTEMAHFEFSELAPYLKRVKTKVVYVNHVNQPERKLIDIENADKSREFSFPILIANDGDSVTV